MRKIVFGLFAVIAASTFLTGCTSPDNDMRNYSINSYQGPLPMEDYRRVNPESYGVPVTPR
jgi:hypothetical protein